MSNKADYEQEFQKLVKEAAKKMIAAKNKRDLLILLTVLLILIFTSFVYAFYFAPEHECGRASEPKVMIGSLKAAVDTYIAKNHNDISELRKYSKSLYDNSPLFEVLRLDESQFDNLTFCDKEDFYIVFLGDEESTDYLIVYDASLEETNGTSGRGLNNLILTYNSRDGLWLEYTERE